MRWFGAHDEVVVKRVVWRPCRFQVGDFEGKLHAGRDVWGDSLASRSDPQLCFEAHADRELCVEQYLSTVDEHVFVNVFDVIRIHDH